jgi:hypothetical protein
MVPERVFVPDVPLGVLEQIQSQTCEIHIFVVSTYECDKMHEIDHSFIEIFIPLIFYNVIMGNKISISTC